MKYKYAGTVTAVILVGDSLANIQPGETVDVPVAPSPQFERVLSDAETNKLIREAQLNPPQDPKLKLIRTGPSSKQQKKDN